MANIRCGNPVHKSFFHSLADEAHHHESVAQVRLCYIRKDEFGIRSLEEQEQSDRWDDEQRAEQLAELAVERYYEDRGADEAYAQREYEDRMGVVQFEDAMRMACGR